MLHPLLIVTWEHNGNSREKVYDRCVHFNGKPQLLNHFHLKKSRPKPLYIYIPFMFHEDFPVHIDYIPKFIYGYPNKYPPYCCFSTPTNSIESIPISHQYCLSSVQTLCCSFTLAGKEQISEFKSKIYWMEQPHRAKSSRLQQLYPLLSASF